MDLEDSGDSPWGDVPTRTQPGAGQDSSKATETSAETKPELHPTTPATADAPRSPAGRAVRGPIRRVQAKATTLNVDDTLGPLGPLGEAAAAVPITSSELPPAPPRKEHILTHNGRQQQATVDNQSAIGMDMNDSGDLMGSPMSGARFPPPVQAAQSSSLRRETQPSVSIEQAAKPHFDITVGDPHKVGDLTSSHIVYQVRTKTTSKAYRQPEFIVTRRYRDFLWLYNSLHSNSPGIVVPPPPEKQAVGRFDTSFVESRRMALERMLNKIAAHTTLQHDGDLKIFLESESFNNDVKHKERKEPGLGESKGMFAGLGLSVGGGGKFVETDDWFHERRVYLDALENQLKALLKAMDTVVMQRKGLAEAAGEFSGSLNALAQVELSPALSIPLAGLSDLQLRIKELYERQAQQDILTLGITIDEYIRLIGSIKMAFEQRQKSFHSWHAAEGEMQKKRSTQDKLLRQGKTQQDRMSQMQADVVDAERKVHAQRLVFEDMGRLMRGELERFEREKVEDFKSGVETFLESAVEAQKELIELWETFLMQLDAEDDENPFYKPPVVPQESADAARLSGETQVQVAAQSTIEAEE